MNCCVYCGKVIRDGIKFCSASCRGKYNVEKTNSIAELLNKHCENCGKKLVRHLHSNGIMESIHNFKKRKYCSLECVGRCNTNKYEDLGDTTLIITRNGEKILIDSDMREP